MGPVIEFKDIKEANEYLKEWKKKLYLDDWIIRVSLIESNDLPNYAGYNDFNIEKQSSYIRIAKLTEDTKNRIMKVCHEHTLVHELLHLKFNLLENADTYEGKFLEIMEHQLIDQMARSLIMAKYNLTPDWYDNNEVDNEQGQ